MVFDKSADNIICVGDEWVDYNDLIKERISADDSGYSLYYVPCPACGLRFYFSNILKQGW